MDIYITADRNVPIKIYLETADGQPYELPEGESLKLTVKKTRYTKEVVLEKTGSEIEILPGETARLKDGTYVYDVVHIFEGSPRKVYPIEELSGNFYILRGVHDETE